MHLPPSPPQQTTLDLNYVLGGTCYTADAIESTHSVYTHTHTHRMCHANGATDSGIDGSAHWIAFHVVSRKFDSMHLCECTSVYLISSTQIYMYRQVYVCTYCWHATRMTHSMFRFLHTPPTRRKSTDHFNKRIHCAHRQDARTVVAHT